MRGALAGAIGQIWVFAINNGSFYLLHFAKNKWLDTISNLMWGHPTRNGIEWAIALTVQWVLASLLGLVYARVVLPEPGSGNYIGRGVGMGLAAYLVLTAIGTIYRVPHAYYDVWSNVATRLIAVVGYGVIVGWLMRRWDYALGEAKNQ
jgi:hypothetical protein